MRIDGTHGLSPQPLTGAEVSAKDAARAKGASGEVEQGAVRMQSQYARYIDAAHATETVDSEAVREARQLLESGRLDTPERARAAAEALLDFGI